MWLVATILESTDPENHSKIQSVSQGFSVWKTPGTYITWKHSLLLPGVHYQGHLHG